MDENTFWHNFVIFFILFAKYATRPSPGRIALKL
jgi:hypothetical protein